MAWSRRTHTREFKVEAMRRVVEDGVPQTHVANGHAKDGFALRLVDTRNGENPNARRIEGSKLTVFTKGIS